MYILTYRKWTMKFAMAMGILLFIFSIMYFVGLIEATETPIFPIAFSIVILFVVPISIYFSSKKNYKTHIRLHEEVSYEITDEAIILTGESFNSEMTWDKTYKVVELRNWFLIYQNKIVANIIPKTSVGNNRNELREIVRRQKFKSRLKNN